MLSLMAHTHTCTHTHTGTSGIYCSCDLTCSQPRTRRSELVLTLTTSLYLQVCVCAAPSAAHSRGGCHLLPTTSCVTPTSERRVLSHRFHRRSFGRSKHVIGKIQIEFDGLKTSAFCAELF